MAENQQKGLLRLVTDLGTREPQVETGQSSFHMPGSGADREMEQAAASLGQLSHKVGALADHAAKVEGRDAGHLAGMDPEFRPSGSRTLRGESFDAAGLQVYKSKQYVAIADQLEQIFETHRGNPGGLEKAMSEARSGWLQGALPETQPDIALHFDKTGLALRRQATREHIERSLHEQHAATQAELAQQLKEMQQQAMRLGLDGTADDALLVQRRQIDGLLGRRAPDGRPLFTPEAREKVLEAVDDTTVTARALGAFDRQPTLEAKQRFLDEFRVEFKESRGLGGSLNLQRFMRTEGLLESELRQARQGNREFTGLIGARIADIEKAASGGISPKPDELAGLKAQVAGTNDIKLQARLALAEATLEFTQAARRLTPDELDGYRKSLRERAADPKRGLADWERQRLELADKLSDSMKSALKEDPLGWAHTVGLTTVAPIDFSSAEKTAQSLQARIVQAEGIAATYGIKPRYLRPNEDRALEAALASGSAQAVNVARAIAASAGPEKAEAIMGELDRKHAGHLALLGLLVARGGDERFIATAANGLAFMRTPDKKPTASLKPAEVESAASSVVGTALSEFPSVRSAAIGLTNYAYEIEAQRKQLTSFDQGLWQSLFRKSLGEREVGGEAYGGVVATGRGWFGRAHSQVVIPANIKQAQFHELVATIEPSDLGDRPPQHGNGKPATGDEIAGAAWLQAGDGRYHLQTGTSPDGTPRVLVDPGGLPFVLDLKALEPVLRARRPDLYLGGSR